MYSKFAGIALVSLALAVAAVAPAASASPVLTNAGKPVPAGTEITGKSTGVIKLTTPTTSSITFECSDADFKLIVTSNSGTNIKGEIPVGSFSYSGTGVNGDCTSNQGPASTVWNSKLCVDTTSEITGEDTITFSGCGGASATFTTTITGLLTCKYASASFKGTFLTTFSDATFVFVEQEFIRDEGSFLCPNSTKLDQDFDLTTTAGGTLVIS